MASEGSYIQLTRGARVATLEIDPSKSMTPLPQSRHLRPASRRRLVGPLTGRRPDPRPAARRPRLRRPVGRFSRETGQADGVRNLCLLARRLRQVLVHPAAAPALLHARRGAREAAESPRRIGFRKGALIGHSDGASIAAHPCRRCRTRISRVQAVVLMAPHFFTEEVGLAASIAEAQRATSTATSSASSPASTSMSTAPSTAGTAPGSTPASADGIWRNSWPRSASPFRSFRARPTSTARWSRSTP